MKQNDSHLNKTKKGLKISIHSTSNLNTNKKKKEDIISKSKLSFGRNHKTSTFVRKQEPINKQFSFKNQRFQIKKKRLKGVWRWGIERRRKKQVVQAITPVAWFNIAHSQLQNRFIPLLQSYTNLKTVEVNLKKEISGSNTNTVALKIRHNLKKYERFDYLNPTLYILDLIFQNKANAHLLAFFFKRQIETNRNHPAFLNFFRETANLYLSQLKKPRIKGFKITINGRLRGRNRSASETIEIGQVPTQKLSQRMDTSFLQAQTKFGSFGIKIWLAFAYHASTSKHKISKTI